MQQIRNYERLLNDSKVKETLKQDGIEYYVPSFNLIVGRASTLPHDEWRWLANSTKNLKILTYDDLVSDMKLRLQSHIDFLNM